jgi:hypothetical protein
LELIAQTTKNLFFHFTITANQKLEFHTPDYKDAIREYIFLAQRYSPEQLVWRYDPICITDKLPFEAYEERFVQCAELLQGHTQNCIISFAQPYKKTNANLLKYAHQTLVELSEEKKRGYAQRLAKRAERYGIRLSACCNDYLLSEEIHPVGDRDTTIGACRGQELAANANEFHKEQKPGVFSNGVKKARCIDGHALSNMLGTPIDIRPASSRKECACTRSIDIGAYDTCAHGCLYCYANTDKNKAIAAREKHNPEWNALMMQVDEKNFAQEEKQTSLPF